MNKKIVLLLSFLTSVFFVSCGKDSLISDAKKCFKDSYCFSEEILEKLKNGKYNIYETDENGFNILTSPDIDISVSDVRILIYDYGFDITKPDSNGNLPIYCKSMDVFSDGDWEQILSINMKTIMNSNEILDLKNLVFHESFSKYMFITQYFDKIDVNIKVDENTSLFQYCLTLEDSFYLESVYQNVNYKKNYEDYSSLLSVMRELNINVSSIYDDYKLFFVYKDANEFVPERKIYMPGDEEYMEMISSELWEIPSSEYVDAYGDFYTMVKTQLKTKNSIVEVPCFTKVEILGVEGDPYIEDGYLINILKVKCNGKEGTMSNRYISSLRAVKDLDLDGKEDNILLNFSIGGPKYKFASIVVIINGKPIKIENKSGEFYFDYSFMQFIDNTSFIKASNSKYSNRVYFYDLSGLNFFYVFDAWLYDIYEDHSILDFNAVTADNNHIYLYRDVNNSSCYDYYDYHYNLNEYDEWYQDAFAYYYDYDTRVVIVREGEGEYIINGEDANYEYYYDDYGI